MSKNGHPNSNGQHVTGSACIVATAAPTANVERADLTINTPEALLALQNHEIQQRQDNKVNLLKKALDGYAALTTNFGPTDFVRGAAFNFLLDGAKDIDAECGYPPWLMPQQYNYMFDREPIANRVVTCLPEETWAEDPEIWEDDDPDTETPFEEAWAALEEQHNLFSMLQRADVLSGIGQFGIILIGIDDGKDLREPVDGIFDDGTVAPEVEHKLLFLRVFSEVVVFVKVREIDITSPRYSQPKIYTIQFRDYPGWGVQAGEIIARDVHWTRVIHLADNRKESEVYGVPRMHPVYNRLYDLRKIYSSSGEGYWKGAFPGLAFEVNPEVAAQGVELDVKSIREEMERFQNGLQRYLALTGVTTKSLPATMMEPGGCVETQLRAIAICLGIPERILWGSEEAVLAGNQDSRAWNKRLGKRQTKYVNPLIIRPFINRFIAMGILPPPKDSMQPADGGNGAFIITGGYKIEWPDLNAPTEMDKAQVAAAETSAMAAYVQGGVSQLMAPREYLTHVLGYSVTEADAILEASMEFSGDEEEPLSAASQMAQEQEAAEQSHDQALELQDAKAKGGKGENTKPERNSAGSGLEVNADNANSILHNPSKKELQGLLGRVYQKHGMYGEKFHNKDGIVLRGVLGQNGDHNWGSAHVYEHESIRKGKWVGSHAGQGETPTGHPQPEIENHGRTNLFALASGRVVRQSANPLFPDHEVPGIGSKLEPVKDVPVANTEKIDKDFILNKEGTYSPVENAEDSPANRVIINPGKDELQDLYDTVHEEHGPGIGRDSTVLRGVASTDAKGGHVWGSAYVHTHGSLRQELHENVGYKKEPQSLLALRDGRIVRVEDSEPHELPGIGSSLRGRGFTRSDSAGMETNSQWQDGWKTELAQSKQERLVKSILTNPSRDDLQNLLDTVHQHNQDNNISYSPLKIVLRGVSNDEGTKHNWGSSYFHEHKDLKQGDHTLDNHLYISTTGHVAKMGRMGGFEPFNVPAIGPKLDKVAPVRVGMKTNARPVEILYNPTKPALMSMWKEHRKEEPNEFEVTRGLVDPKNGDHFWSKGSAITHDEMKKRIDPSSSRQLHEVWLSDKGRVENGGSLRGERLPEEVHSVVKKVGLLPSKYQGQGKPWHLATNAEPPLHQQILTNPTKPDLQGLFNTVHHRLSGAQPWGPNDAVLRGVVSRAGDKHVWGNAFEYEHEELKDKSGDSDIDKGSHLYIHPNGKIWKFGKGFQQQEYSVPGIGSKLSPPTPPDTRTTPAGLQWGNRDVVANVDKDREFSSTQIQLHPSIADRIKAMGMQIPDSELADDGRETDPHVTLKYGLHTNDPNDVSALLHGEPTIRYKLGKTSLFPASGDRDYDVVKVDIHSPDLHRLNGKIASALEHTDTHPVYKPHATVAYVKAGMGKKYEGLEDCEGLHGICDHVIFSGKEKDSKTPIQLTMNKARPRDMLHDQDQNLTPPQEDQPKPYAEVENLPGDPDQDEEQRGEGGLGGANPDNGDALATPNLSREGVKHPVDPEMIQLPTLNVDGGTEFKTYKVVDGDEQIEQE